MSLQLYDTLSAKKRPFIPLKQGKVSLYVCGMTVYDDCHIGHARVMIGFDVLYRWLCQLGYQVEYVRNITDIDDKIIQRAAANAESIYTLTNRCIASMHADADALGCHRPTQEPKATDYINQMQAMIHALSNKGLAYQGASGDVYYAVDKFQDYGKLSKRRLADMQAGASNRVEGDDDKANPFDFVLWKAAKADEPAEVQWESPWGAGRPGWHIECSAMSTCCLGESFDIHGGGFDLQFPHHENEIAQSEGATGKTYAGYWLHVGFVNVDGEKMSKSLGNFFTIKEIMEKFHPETIRFFMLLSHYRSPVNFSDTALKEAHSGLSRLYHALKGTTAKIDPTVWGGDFGKTLGEAMNDDINTPKAVSVLFALASELNRAKKDGDEGEIQRLANTLKTLALVLNIAQLEPVQFLQASIGDKADGLSEDDIAQKIKQRADAKTAKDYATADQIRNDLLAQGIELEDSRQGTTWRRVW